MLAFFERIIAFFMSLLSFLGFNIRPVQKNYAYADLSPRQVMDIYMPAVAEKIKEPVNVYIMLHGGGWTLGQKESYDKQCQEIAKNGIVAVTMNYRFFDSNPQTVFINDVIDDLDSAIKAIDKKLRADGLTPNKLILQGYSAGASTVLYYVATRLEESAIPVAFVVNQASPMGYGEGFGINPEHLANPSMPGAFVDNAVINYVNANLPPMILCYGDKDELTSPAQVSEYTAKLDAAGVKYDLFRYPNTDHNLKTLKADFDVQEAADAKFYEYVGLYAR